MVSNYLSYRIQRVVINGQTSSWGKIQVLGPLLFLLYINDLTAVITHCNIRLFADDTCLFIEVDNRNTTANMINEDLQAIHIWSQQWLVSFSPTKTKGLTISNKQDAYANPPVSFNDCPIEEVKSHTYLGLKFSHNLRCHEHINDIALKTRISYDNNINKLP